MIEIRRIAISLQSVHLGQQKRRIPRGSIHRALLHSSATTRLDGTISPFSLQVLPQGSCIHLSKMALYEFSAPNHRSQITPMLHALV